MISLRSHAISLAAVFLALAVGVVLGSGLLSDTVLSGLRKDKADLHEQINTLTDDKNALNEKLSAAGEFDSMMAPRILRDTLGGKSVVIFRTPDAADDDVDAVTRLATQSGATVTGAISLTPQFVDANSSEKLLSVVNSSILPAGRQLSTKSVDQVRRPATCSVSRCCPARIPRWSTTNVTRCSPRCARQASSPMTPSTSAPPTPR